MSGNSSTNLTFAIVRSLRFVIALYVLPVTVALAQPQRQTEVQSDGFLGQVKAEVSYVETYGVQFEQPEGPGLVGPVFCLDCEYAPDGYRTKFGEILPNGSFYGDTIQLIRDSGGHVVESISTDFASGKMSGHDWLGPFGPTKTESFFDGKLMERQIFTYDHLGHLAHRTIIHGDGTREELDMKNADDGTMLKSFAWGNDGAFGSEWYDSIDAQSNSSLLAKTNGKKLQQALSYKNGNIDSFWAASPRSNQAGGIFIEELKNGDWIRYSCRKRGACEAAHIHYEYAGKARRNPTSAEWRDSNGKLLYAAYYEYQFDSEGNWTHRKIWVRSPDLPNRTLYETDSRDITYWNR